MGSSWSLLGMLTRSSRRLNGVPVQLKRDSNRLHDTEPEGVPDDEEEDQAPPIHQRAEGGDHEGPRFSGPD